MTTWVTTGSGLSGWMRKGSVPATSLPGTDFWARALRVACWAEGGFIDAAQCYDAAILTAGPIQATARFGTLQKMLAAIPDELLRGHLADAFRVSGLSLRRSPASFVSGLDVVATEVMLRQHLLGGCNGRSWSETQKEHALRWVDGLGQLCADRDVLPYIARASVDELRVYALPEAWAILTATPVAGAAYAGQPVAPPTTPDKRRAAACYIAFSINNPRGAVALLKQNGADADAMMLGAAKAGPWPPTFATRVSRTAAALAREDWR